MVLGRRLLRVGLDLEAEVAETTDRGTGGCLAWLREGETTGSHGDPAMNMPHPPGVNGTKP